MFHYAATPFRFITIYFHAAFHYFHYFDIFIIAGFHAITFAIISC